MPEHKVGTREEWQAARDELAKLEAQHAELNEEIKKQAARAPMGPGREGVRVRHRGREEDPWPSSSTAARSSSPTTSCTGPITTVGACPGCTSLGDEFGGALIHLNKRDVTFLCFSRAPIDRLAAYKQRMGWQFPYVSTYDTDFPWDFGLAMTEEQAERDPRGEGDDRQPARVAPGVVASRSGRSSRTACARARATSRSRARTGPSTTPTR